MLHRHSVQASNGSRQLQDSKQGLLLHLKGGLAAPVNVLCPTSVPLCLQVVAAAFRRGRCAGSAGRVQHPKAPTAGARPHGEASCGASWLVMQETTPPPGCWAHHMVDPAGTWFLLRC